MNPARSYGPSLLSRYPDRAWVYEVGLTVGSLLAVLFTWLLHGTPGKHERQAAKGTAAKREKGIGLFGMGKIDIMADGLARIGANILYRLNLGILANDG